MFEKIAEFFKDYRKIDYDTTILHDLIITMNIDNVDVKTVFNIDLYLKSRGYKISKIKGSSSSEIKFTIDYISISEFTFIILLVILIIILAIGLMAIVIIIAKMLYPHYHIDIMDPICNI